MMSFTDWTALGFGLLVLVTVAGWWLCWKLAYKDGWDDGRDYQKERAYLRAIRAEDEGAERSRVRRGSSLPAAPIPWYSEVHPGPKPRVVTTADDLAPVIIPRGATIIPWQPQPGRTSGTGTVAMPALTATGEMRAVTDAFIELIEAREAEYRAGMTS